MFIFENNSEINNEKWKKEQSHLVLVHPLFILEFLTQGLTESFKQRKQIYKLCIKWPNSCYYYVQMVLV